MTDTPNVTDLAAKLRAIARAKAQARDSSEWAAGAEAEWKAADALEAQAAIAALTKERDEWKGGAEQYHSLLNIARSKQPKQVKEAPLTGGELWEYLFGAMNGAVPDELSGKVLDGLAKHIRENF